MKNPSSECSTTCSGGALVWFYYDNSAGTIHVSGHASQEEAKTFAATVKPEYFIRCTGVPASVRHAALRKSTGMRVRGDFAFEDGRQIEFT